jgi:predicted GNAT family N-acyltransferase
MPRSESETLKQRHLALGWLTLLVFLTLGIALEALHGFKIGSYLDVDHEARRLGLRLAHAHGVLLGLVHLAFAWTLGASLRTLDRAKLSSQLLAAATILLPGGFFLGGLFARGGDPGLGILLVPCGAICLFVAVLFVVLALSGREAVAALSLREFPFGTLEYETSVGLRYGVLRAPLGLKLGPDERREEATLIHLGAFEGERLVGCLMLHDRGDGSVRMRQVAIAMDRQRSGIGRKLVAFSETHARELGLREMILHARDTAVPFYEKLGYESFGEPFEEVTIPHRKMRKTLAPPA